MLQGRSQARNEHEAGSKQNTLLCPTDLASYLMLVSCLAYSLTLITKAKSFRTSVDFQRTIRRYIPEDITLHILFILDCLGWGTKKQNRTSRSTMGKIYEIIFLVKLTL
jgi:hypothetical protein